MKKSTLVVSSVTVLFLCLTPLAYTAPWWTDQKPNVEPVELDHITGEVVIKEPKTLDINSCWQLGLRVASSPGIKWVCVPEEDWKKYIISSTYSR